MSRYYFQDLVLVKREVEDNTKVQLLEREQASICQKFNSLSSNLWDLFILIQIIVLVSSPPIPCPAIVWDKNCPTF